MDNHVKYVLTVSIPLIAIMLSVLKRRAKRADQVKNKRRVWSRKWISRRQEGRGLLHMVERELCFEDPLAYKNFLRMDNIQFKKLLGLVENDLTRRNTNMREYISASTRLAVTLRYVATGETYRSLMYSTRIHESTLSLIIPETLESIYRHLRDRYLKMPSNSSEWKDIAEDFYKKWNFPLCIGAIDGKHINFQAPVSAGSFYYNYKGTHSIVLLALVDANYKFIYINIGVNGRVSDGGVFGASSLKTAMDSNLIQFPADQQLPGQSIALPYVIVADAAFPLSRRLVKPYPNRGLSKEKRIFNYRLSRARRVVENAFGILSNRFRVLLQTINLAPAKVENIVLACCALHNFLATENPVGYLEEPEQNFDGHLSNGLRELQGADRPTQEALFLRECFMEYFNSVGAVSWQNEITNL